MDSGGASQPKSTITIVRTEGSKSVPYGGKTVFRGYLDIDGHHPVYV